MDSKVLADLQHRLDDENEYRRDVLRVHFEKNTWEIYVSLLLSKYLQKLILDNKDSGYTGNSLYRGDVY